MKKGLRTILFLAVAAVSFIFTACGFAYKDIKIVASYQGQDKGYLSLNVGQEANVEFTVSSLPSGVSAKLNFSKDSNIITTPVVVSVDQSTGVNKVKFTALTAGNANLRAIAEGGNYIEINVRVTLTIQDFTLKDDVSLFAVRGETNSKNLTLNSSIFNFNPAETNQKEIVFKDSQNNTITEIIANDYPNQSYVSVKATSPYLSKELEVRISLIDEIAEVYTEENPANDLILITNRSEHSRKTLRLIIPSNTNELLRVSRSVVSQNILQVSEFDISRKIVNENDTIFEFELQSLQEGKAVVEFDIYYEGYESYTIKRTFNVVIKNAPDEIRANDLTQLQLPTPTVLFDGAYSTVYSSHYISVLPTTSVYDEISFSYEFDGQPVQNLNNYIQFTVNGSPISSTLTSLIKPLIAKGLHSTEDKIASIIINVKYGLNLNIETQSTLTYRLDYIVKTGASSLLIKQEYTSQNQILYVEANSGAVQFNGLYVAQTTAYTQNISIVPISQGAALYAQVTPTFVQNENDYIVNGIKEIPLTINPLSPGKSRWRVTLPNGIYREITVVVVPKVNSVKLDFDEGTSSASSKKEYDSNNNLIAVQIKLNKIDNLNQARLQLKYVANPTSINLSDSNLYTLNRNITGNIPQGLNIEQTSSNLINFRLQPTTNSFNVNYVYELYIKQVSNFKLYGINDYQVGTEEYNEYVENYKKSGQLNIKGYVPLSNVSFNVREVSLYSESVLGLNYKSAASQNLSILYSPNELAAEFNNIKLENATGDVRIIISSSLPGQLVVEDVEGQLQEKYVVNGYGEYNFTTGKLTVNVNNSNYQTFYIYANIHYFNEIYQAVLKVNPLEYQAVNGVRLYDYISEIYLDPTHPYYDVYAYAVPQNAVHKDLQFTFEPNTGTSPLVVRIENTFNNGIRVIYNNSIQGLTPKGSGYLVISPLASITNTSMPAPNQLKIPIRIGDGSIENPFRINTATELLNISISGLDKHYTLESIIDISNINLTSLGVFTGSINGLGTGKITGINVKGLSQNGFGGLFEKIQPQIVNNSTVAGTGIIKNLVFEGSINLALTTAGSIGLVAGELGEGAELTNVQVNLNQSSVTINTAEVVNIGGVVGYNLGTIKTIVGQDYKNFSQVVMNGRFSVISSNGAGQNRGFFGGVVGVNDGQIIRYIQEDKKLYGNDTYTSVVNMYLNGENLRMSAGAIAGKNLKVITSQRQDGLAFDNVTYFGYNKANGIIDAFQAHNHIGGLIGDNLSGSSIPDSTVMEYGLSRVKLVIRGIGESDAFTGGLFGYNYGGVVRNSVIQAIEDGVSIGTSATMLYSTGFGLETGTTPNLNGRFNIFGFIEAINAGSAYAVHTNSSSAESGAYITNNNLLSQTFIGTQDDLNVPVGKRAFVEITTFATINNYFGDYLVGTHRVKFTPVTATLVENETNRTNRLISQNPQTSNLVMAYMFLYNAENSADQSIINLYNTQDLPFDFEGEVNLFSYNTSIISISNSGKVVVHSTGVVRIKVISALNAKISQDVYIYVVHAVNNFKLYVSSLSAGNEITSGDNKIDIYSNQTIPLIVHYYGILNMNGYDVVLKSAQEYNIIDKSTDSELEGYVRTVSLIKLGSVYGFEAINGKGRTNFIIYSNLSIMFDNALYLVEDDDFLLNENSSPIFYEFGVEHHIGATEIKSNIDYISIEPIDRFNFDIKVKTDDFDEKITLDVRKFVQNGIPQSGNYFNVNETNRKYQVRISEFFPENYFSNFATEDLIKFVLKITQTNSSSGENTSVDVVIEFNRENNLIKIGSNYYEFIDLNINSYFEINQHVSYTYSFEIKLKEDINDDEFNGDMLVGTSLSSYLNLEQIQIYFSASFNMPENELNYKSEYYINFVASTNAQLYSALTININSQSVSQIIMSSFEGSTASDINAGQEQWLFVDPQSPNPNHFRISVYPIYADYDYIEIVNETSSVSSILTWINKNGGNKFGAYLLSNGIRISKANVQSQINLEDYIYVRYAVGSSSVSNGQVVSYSVNAYKNGVLIGKSTRNIVVKFSQDVTFAIYAKPVTTADNKVYLTRGSTYQFTLSSIGYAESEIFFETTIPSAVTINKSAKTIAISSSISYGQNNLQGTIEVYGRKIVQGDTVTSRPYVINVEIVDFYVIQTDEHKIIKNGSNGVVSVAIGNTYTLSTEFLSGLTVEYNTNISSIKQTINNFEKQINEGGLWEYKIGDYAWEPITASVDSIKSNGYFTITKVGLNYIFTPLKIASSENPQYKFRLTYGYDYERGFAVYSENVNVKVEEFTFNVFQLSSMDTPTPIYTLNEFVNMNVGVYYILMENIVLPSSFQPITNLIAGLDGNNKKIIINSNMAVDTQNAKVGIFSQIGANALIRNLNIEISAVSSLTVNQQNTTNTYVGILAGENNGVITNVSVKTLSSASFKVLFGSTFQSIKYVGGLVGINNGYISHSRASISLTSGANLAGFVGYNLGKISNSYVNNSLIINTSTEAQNKTAGFTVYNGTASSSGGKIINSYVTGLHSGVVINTIYANDNAKIIRSSTEVAGFIYENNGEITNSYSNIPIQTSTKSAGFVYINGGLIKNAYSTSRLKVNSQESYGFVYDTSTGTLQNTYYLGDTDINYSINTSNLSMRYTKAQFGEVANFSTFAFIGTNNLNDGIWFIPSQGYDGTFNNPEKTFISGRPELVAANILSTSELAVDISRTTQDDITGAITYYYNNVGAYSIGSIYNPYIIISASEFESRILNSNSVNINTNSYRIVSDITYDDTQIVSSRLFNTIFVGDIEGNGMEIRGYIVDSSVSVATSGLFAKIGNGSSQQGSVKNLTLKPRYINLPNSISVGALAGTLDAGTILNVTMDSFAYSSTGIVVLGKNIVGGVIGRAINSYNIINVTSSISANATYRSSAILGSSEDGTIGSYFIYRTHSTTTLSRLSYSGAVAGVLAGKGNVKFVKVNGVIASMGEFAGLMFGGVGDGVTINNADLTIVQGQFIQSAVYGGLVAGEFYGKLNNANVISANPVTGLFKDLPFKPVAIGGLVGLMGSSNNLPFKESSTGGLISNSVVKVSIEMPTLQIVGGLVGEMIGGAVETSGFVGSISSYMIAGGIVGKVSYKPSTMATVSLTGTTLLNGFADNATHNLLNQTYVRGGILKVNNTDNRKVAYVGGLIGTLLLSFESEAVLRINNSYSTNRIEVASDAYGSQFDIYTGGLVGKLSKEVKEQDETYIAKLQINTSYFSGKIIQKLRNLIYVGEEAGFGEMYFGRIVANQISSFIVDSSADNYYAPSSVIYDAENVPLNDTTNNFYMLLKYIYENQLVNNTNQGVFTVFDLGEGQNDLPVNKVLNGFSASLWTLTANNLPVLKIEK